MTRTIQNNWQTIDSAPKDGTVILMFKHGWEAAYLCYWKGGKYHGVRDWWTANESLPTHWCYPPIEEKADD